MRNFKKFLSLLLVISCCCALFNISVFAQETSMTQEVTLSNDVTPFAAGVNVSYPAQKEFVLNQRIISFKYSAAATSLFVQTGFIMLRFTNVDTGISTSSYYFIVPDMAGTLNCNIEPGRYRISQVNGTPGLSANIHLNF